jgi:hypothetical protein
LRDLLRRQAGGRVCGGHCCGIGRMLYVEDRRKGGREGEGGGGPSAASGGDLKKATRTVVRADEDGDECRAGGEKCES